MQYTVKTGENLFDIALNIYGSIEGIYYLLMANNISIDTQLKSGDVLEYYPDYIINQSIVDWMEKNLVKAKNGKIALDNTEAYAFGMSKVNEANQNVKSLYESGEIKFDFSASSASSIPQAQIGLKTTGTNTSQLGTFKKTALIGNENVSDNSGVSVAESTDWSEDVRGSSDIYSAEAMAFVNTLLGVDLSVYSETVQKKNLNMLYKYGMIVIPTVEEDLDEYINNVKDTKIVIQHVGTSSMINMQLKQNAWIVIDWDDNTGLQFYSYQQETYNITHDYAGTGEHKIKIYGLMQFNNLDFSRLRGVYYALAPVIVYGEFITPFPYATKLNQLFSIL